MPIIFSNKYYTSLIILFLIFQSNQIIDPSQGQGANDTIIYAMPYDFDEYSIFTADSYATAQWNSAVYNGLVRRLSSGEWNYDLAVRLPTITADGLTYRFSLKDNLLFSNGHRLTTSDVAFSFKAALSPAVNTNFYGKFIGSLNNDSIKIIDELTVEFTFLQQIPFPLTLLNFPITDEAVFSYRFDRCEAGIYEDCLWNDPQGLDAVGAGPFKILEIDNVHEIVSLEANPYYYNADQVKTDRLIFQKIADKDAAISALASGLIDILDSQYVPGLEELKDIDGVAETFIGDLAHQEISLNHLNPYFGTGEDIPGNSGLPNYEDALQVRKAMSHIVDRPFAANEIMEGLATQATTVMPPSSFGWDSSLTPRDFSIETAMSFMEAAGFDYANAGTQDDKGIWSSPFFEITLLAPNTGPARNQWQYNFFLELPKIGIGVKEFVATGWGEIVPRTFGYADGLPPSYDEGGFDIFFVGYGWALDWNPVGLYDSSGRCDVGNCGNFYNFDIYENQTNIGSLVRDYLNELDFETQMDLVKDLQTAIYANEPVISIIHPTSHWGAGDNLQGLDYLMFSTNQQDWSKVEIDGFTYNSKSTEVVPDDISTVESDSEDNSVSTTLAEFQLTFIITISFTMLIIIKRRKLSI
ncbi:MAG: ABC transporter substrate-binding protein [Candidatus Heimdallarchaeota archaeon]|nr:ABC transporter substrate-binding protein [Candidatus Heimdallarchaeota archaeon]